MIYILSNDHKETASMLDDKSLDKQIRDIAHTLFMVNYLYVCRQEQCDHLKLCQILKETGFKHAKRNKDGYLVESKWCQWARECKANYLWLVELGTACLDERFDRLGVFEERYEHDTPYIHCLKYKELKVEKAIEWARYNVPDLPEDCKICRYKNC